jgi:hypothetical protein
VLLLLAITGVQNSGDDRVQALQAMVTGAGAAFARIFREYIPGDVGVGGRDAMSPPAGRWCRGRGGRR